MNRSDSTSLVAIVLAALSVACSDSNGPSSPSSAPLECTIPTGQIFDGGPGKDGIPSLTDPPMVGVGEPELAYLRDDDRVIGLLTGDTPIAVPHNIGWWHEVVNLDVGGVPIAVTFCPLTGSSLAFDRTPAGGATFGVSGLLYRNNLIMYDRNQPESLWPQMARAARCGARSGTPLAMVPVIEMTWAAWRSMHPDTRVVSGDLGMGRDYTVYPYGSYDVVGNDQLLFPLDDVDRRRELKERLLGIPSSEGDGGIAFPFGELARLGGVAAVRREIEGRDVVILWDERARAAMAFHPVADGRTLTFEVHGGALVDRETGTIWDVDGHARFGPLEGTRLQPIAEAYVAFWFAWAAFQPDTHLWTASEVT